MGERGALRGFGDCCICFDRVCSGFEGCGTGLAGISRTDKKAAMVRACLGEAAAAGAILVPSEAKIGRLRRGAGPDS